MGRRDQRSNYRSSVAKDWFYAKKKTYGYRERDALKRATFVAQLATMSPLDLVYADEAGMDHRDQYGYGCSPKGERLYDLKAGTRVTRVNMIAAPCNQQLLAPFTIEAACNRTVFEIWLETCLVPVLRPGQKLVIDNGTFDKGGRLESLVQTAGYEIWYLPPYSPDLNKIERGWSWLKSWIPKQLDNFDAL